MNLLTSISVSHHQKENPPKSSTRHLPNTVLSPSSTVATVHPGPSRVPLGSTSKHCAPCSAVLLRNTKHRCALRTSPGILDGGHRAGAASAPSKPWVTFPPAPGKALFVPPALETPAVLGGFVSDPWIHVCVHDPVSAEVPVSRGVDGRVMRDAHHECST